MISSNITTQSSKWQSRPLCCRYLAVFLECLPLPVRDEGVARDLKAHWAFGLLADGQYDVLGVWPDPVSSAMDWQEVFDDLKVRGVERVQFVGTTDSVVVRAAYPAATVLCLIGQLLRQGLALVAPRERRSAAIVLSALRAAGSAQATRAALTNLSASPWGAKYPAAVETWRASLALLAPFFALAPRVRRMMRSADEAAQRVHAQVIRAVARHGCFADREAAVSFMVEALQRAERGLRAPRVGLAVYAGHRTSGAGNRPGIEALGL